jgi:hypothetical protein
MMEDRKCIKCQEIINPLRIKALPKTMTCVDCSTVGIKKGISVMLGEKDHTWNDMMIMEPDEVKIFETKKKYLDKEILELKETDEDDNGKENIIIEGEDDFSDWDNLLLDDLDDL